LTKRLTEQAHAFVELIGVAIILGGIILGKWHFSFGRPTRNVHREKFCPNTRPELRYEQAVEAERNDRRAPRLDNESQIKDIDFSPSGIRERWHAGYADTCRALARAA
jgi:hypothetical protein